MIRIVLTLAFSLFSLASCASVDAGRGSATVVGNTQTGVASWYGLDENGDKTANGENLDKNAFTAAHKSLPFGTIVRVVNLDNGRDVMVRINDRGPFVKNRIIDLNYAPARYIDMIGSGTARAKVVVESVPGGNENPFIAVFTVQVGSFRDKLRAQRLKREVSRRVSDDVRIERFILKSNLYHRVRVGRLETRRKAERLASTLRRKGFESKVIQQ